eukprot:15483222-Alexandrium_andersonii.AAC.1
MFVRQRTSLCAKCSWRNAFPGGVASSLQGAWKSASPLQTPRRLHVTPPGSALFHQHPAC